MSNAIWEDLLYSIKNIILWLVDREALNIIGAYAQYDHITIAVENGRQMVH